MIKDEFEQEIHRVLRAFGLPSPMPFSIRHDIITHWSSGEPVENGPLHFLEFWLETKTFRLRLTRRIGTPDDRFSIRLIESHITPYEKRKVTFFTQTTTKQFLHRTHDTTEPAQDHESLLLPALVNLGYDVVSLCDQAGIELTAHERIEWTLRHREANPIP